MRTASRRHRAAFTLMESLTALAVLAVAGSALVAGVYSAVQTAEFAVELQVAQGLADQMFDEIAGWRYAEPGIGPYQTTLGPEAGETSSSGRIHFDDLDDYHGLAEQPPTDRYGIAQGNEDGAGATRHPSFAAPGNYFNNWRREVTVGYVNASNQAVASSTPTDFRSVEVRIYKVEPQGNRLVTSQRRVFAYVPRP